jgi:hypothetical protein
MRTLQGLPVMPRWPDSDVLRVKKRTKVDNQ